MDRLLEFAQQNLLLSLALAGLTLALVVTEVMRLFRGFKGVSPAQLTELINRENALVVDLRGLAPGAYTVEARTPDRRWSARFVR